MKNKGFTLIEVLGVVVILSILVVIGTRSIASIIKKSKVELSNLQIESIKESAKALANDNVLYMPSINKCKYITLSDLYDYGYFNDEVINPQKNEAYDDVYVSVCAQVSNSLNTLSYNYEIKYLDENEKVESGMNPFFLAEPDLYNNSLTPIVYVRLTYEDSSLTGTPQREILNGTEVIAATSDNEVYEWQVPYEDDVWYDYDNGMWANAVVLNNGVEKKPGDSIDVNFADDSSIDAVGMFVWIPRYSYTIDCKWKDASNFCLGNYDNAEKLNASTDKEYTTRGAIDIKFVSTNVKSRKTAKYTSDKPKNWYTMPAFTIKDGNNIIELDGIWIGKFNISIYNESNNEYYVQNTKCYSENCANNYLIRSLPYSRILTNNPHKALYYLSNAFSKIMNKDSYMDSHMIKGSEWSTAAYLSQSLYGKYGNIRYSDINKQVYKNNAELITGKSNGKIETDKLCIDETDSFNDGCNYQYNYDNLIDVSDGKGSLGAGASTTGTIYGVYDMVGAGYEYVMFNANNTPKNGVFTAAELTNMSLKYIDKYDVLSNTCNNENCLGQGFDTTRRNIAADYLSGYNTINTSNKFYPYCVRGTHYGGDTGEAANIFTFYAASGPGTGLEGGPRNTSRMAIFKRF